MVGWCVVNDIYAKREGRKEGRRETHRTIVVVSQSQVNAYDPFVVALDISPADRREVGDHILPDIVEDAGLTEDPGGWTAVLSRAKAGIDVRPGFEDGDGYVSGQ